MKNNIKNQIDKITIWLIQKGLSIAQNYPIISGDEIVWQNFKSIAHALKDHTYDETYNQYLEDQSYNFMLLDLSIIQLMYRFNDNNLIEHRLLFLPHPNIERFQDDPENYESRYYGDLQFSDMIEKIDNNVTRFPIRFDYNADDQIAIDCDHPQSHLTIGNYTNCRIPVVCPISPYRFIQFILRNFYFDKYKENFNDSDFHCGLAFTRKITANENKLLHVNYEI